VAAIADAWGSRPLADAAAALRHRQGGATEEPWHPLTGRELEVATLLADGLTNAAIAERLGVSPRTVSAHVEHILAKLGVGRRVEVAAWVVTMRAGRGGGQ
jgi:DNA-binding NarL/FixJ family response regulator